MLYRHQGTQKKSHLPVHPVRGRQTSVWAVEPGEPVNLPRFLWPRGKGGHGELESADLGRYPRTGGEFAKVQPS